LQKRIRFIMIFEYYIVTLVTLQTLYFGYKEHQQWKKRKDLW
jgi:hypothetical protein